MMSEENSVDAQHEEEVKAVVAYVVDREPKTAPTMLEFLVRLDMQYSGLSPGSTLLSPEELRRSVHLDVISTRKINVLTLRTQAEFLVHLAQGRQEVLDWLEEDLERRLQHVLDDVAEQGDEFFYTRLADIFLHQFSLKNYVWLEVKAALETLMPQEDLKKFSYLDSKDQIKTIKDLFNRALGCMMLFSPRGGLAAELTGMYLALLDLQVLLTAELESDLGDSVAYVGLIQALLDHHQPSGCFDAVFAEAHALLALHLQLELFYKRMLRHLLSSKARLEVLEFRVDTLKSELLLDREQHATGDAPVSMLANLQLLGAGFRDVLCEFLVVSNVNGVYDRLKGVGELVFHAMHQDTFSQIFGQFAKTPKVDDSEAPSPRDPEPPHLEELFEAPWQKYNPDIPLALNGICIVSVLDGPYLRKGDLELGVCVWQNRSYALSTPEAMDAFGRNPRRFVDGVHCAGHSRPELILLLDLQDRFPQLQPLQTLRQPFHARSQTCWARAERLPEPEVAPRTWAEWDQPPPPEVQVDQKIVPAEPKWVQRHQETDAAPKIDSEVQTMSDVAIGTDREVVPALRLLSLCDFQPYWVSDAEDEWLTSEVDLVQTDCESEEGAPEAASDI